MKLTIDLTWPELCKYNTDLHFQGGEIIDHLRNKDADVNRNATKQYHLISKHNGKPLCFAIK